MGWYTAEDEGTLWSFTTNVEWNMTLYAHWAWDINSSRTYDMSAEDLTGVIIRIKVDNAFFLGNEIAVPIANLNSVQAESDELMIMIYPSQVKKDGTSITIFAYTDDGYEDEILRIRIIADSDGKVCTLEVEYQNEQKL